MRTMAGSAYVPDDQNQPNDWYANFRSGVLPTVLDMEILSYNDSRDNRRMFKGSCAAVKKSQCH